MRNDSGRWLRKKEIAARLGVHPETVGRMVRENRFPRAIKLSINGACRWPEHVVEQWEADQLAKIGLKARAPLAAAA